MKRNNTATKARQVQALNNRRSLEQASPTVGAKRTCPSTETLDRKKSKRRRKIPTSGGGAIKSQVNSKRTTISAKPTSVSTTKTPAVAVTQVPRVTPATPRNLGNALDTESDEDTVLDEPTLDLETSLDESSKVLDKLALAGADNIDLEAVQEAVKDLLIMGNQMSAEERASYKPKGMEAIIQDLRSDKEALKKTIQDLQEAHEGLNHPVQIQKMLALHKATIEAIEQARVNKSLHEVCSDALERTHSEAKESNRLLEEAKRKIEELTAKLNGTSVEEPPAKRTRSQGPVVESNKGFDGVRTIDPMEYTALEIKVEQLEKERDGYKQALHDSNMKGLSQLYLDEADKVPGNLDQYEDGAHDLRVAQLTKEKEDLKAKLAAVEKDYGDLNGKYNSMLTKLKATGKALKEEISGEVVKQAREYFKTHLWPMKKLVDFQDVDEVEAVTKSIYDGIKEDQQFEKEGGRYQLDFDNFHRIYSKKIVEHISTMRSTCQTECKKAVMGKLT